MTAPNTGLRSACAICRWIEAWMESWYRLGCFVDGGVRKESAEPRSHKENYPAEIWRPLTCFEEFSFSSSYHSSVQIESKESLLFDCRKRFKKKKGWMTKYRFEHIESFLEWSLQPASELSSSCHAVQNPGCWAKVEMAYLSLHILTCNSINEWMIDWLIDWSTFFEVNLNFRDEVGIA